MLIDDWIIEIIDSFGYLGVCFLVAIENLFPPIPSEVILTFGGFLTTRSSMNVWIVILAATIGSLIGAIALYALGRTLTEDRLTRFFMSRTGRFLRLKNDDLIRAKGWFAKHGAKTIFLCRFVPIIRSLISIPAGIAKMQFFPFLVLTITGTAIWNIVLIFLGRFAGNSWDSVVAYFDAYSFIAGAVIILICIILLARFIHKRSSKQQNGK